MVRRSMLLAAAMVASAGGQVVGDSGGGMKSAFTAMVCQSLPQFVCSGIKPTPASTGCTDHDCCLQSSCAPLPMASCNSARGATTCFGWGLNGAGMCKCTDGVCGGRGVCIPLTGANGGNTFGGNTFGGNNVGGNTGGSSFVSSIANSVFGGGSTNTGGTSSLGGNNGGSSFFGGNTGGSNSGGSSLVSSIANSVFGGGSTNTGRTSSSSGNTGGSSFFGGNTGGSFFGGNNGGSSFSGNSDGGFGLSRLYDEQEEPQVPPEDLTAALAVNGLVAVGLLTGAVVFAYRGFKRLRRSEASASAAFEPLTEELGLEEEEEEEEQAIE